MAVEVVLDRDELIVRVSGLDRFVCFSNGFRIPLDQVAGARIAEWDEVRAGLGWRTMGSYVPGLIATGWYAVPSGPGERQFLAVFRDRSHLLVIDTRLVKPRRVVVADRRAEEIVAALRQRIEG
jgi:hypothetical protein